MKHYLLAVGGTGNKILESVVWACAADALTAGDGLCEQLDMLSVDVDASCGNTTRAMQACAHYEEVRAMLAGFPYAHPGFHTRLSLRQWNMDLRARSATVESQTADHKRDQLLARTLFDHQEATLAYSEGFRGHPDLGVLFFSTLLRGVDAGSTKADELSAMLSDMDAELAAGGRVKLLLVGSVFGGTGASGIPALSRFLRERFRDRADRVELGAVLMLPYYRVPPAEADPGEEIVVESDAFLDKARTALQYYGMEGMLRKNAADEKGVYDAAFLLGLPESHFISTANYSTGSQSQRNDAHLLEWLAARCLSRFLATDYRAEGGRDVNCYYYQIGSTRFTWESFDRDCARYRLGYGRLMKAAMLWLAELGPALADHFASPRRMRDRTLGWYAAHFRRLPRMSPEDQARLDKERLSVGETLLGAARWMGETVRSLPPQLRHAGLLEQAALESDDNYRRLVDAYLRVRQLTLQAERTAQGRILRFSDEETQTVSEALRQRQKELEALQARQKALDVQTGGQIRLEACCAYATELESRLDEEVRACEKAQEDADRLSRLPEKQRDPQRMREAAETLLRMEGRQQAAQARLDFVREDMKLLAMPEKREVPPACAAKTDAQLDSDLFGPKAMAALWDLCGRTEQGERITPRQAEKALRQVDRLVALPAPDRVGIRRIYQKLGGGQGSGRNVDPMALLLARLLDSVMEESKA